MTDPKSSGPAAPATAAATAAEAKRKRSRLSQEDVPGYPLDQALRVARAIAENYAYKPARPMNVAEAMGMSPSSGPFRGITGAAVAYGITTGAAQAPEIALTPLGLRIVRPTVEGDDLAARREALLKPRIVGEFLRDYDSASLPTNDIAKNVLEQKGVPRERANDVLELITSSAEAVGFIRVIGGKRYVDLATPAGVASQSEEPSANENGNQNGTAPVVTATPQPQPITPTPTSISVGPGVHVNIEIHIAADASSETIEEIFRNMRRYVLSGEGQSADEEPASQ